MGNLVERTNWRQLYHFPVLALMKGNTQRLHADRL